MLGNGQTDTLITHTHTNQTAYIFFANDARPEVKASSRDACSCATLSFPMHVAHKQSTHLQLTRSVSPRIAGGDGRRLVR